MEPRKLYLGNLRRDENKNRKNVLESMDKVLKDYGEDFSYNHKKRCS